MRRSDIVAFLPHSDAYFVVAVELNFFFFFLRLTKIASVAHELKCTRRGHKNTNKLQIGIRSHASLRAKTSQVCYLCFDFCAEPQTMRLTLSCTDHLHTSLFSFFFFFYCLSRFLHLILPHYSLQISPCLDTLARARMRVHVPCWRASARARATVCHYGREGGRSSPFSRNTPRTNVPHLCTVQRSLSSITGALH